MSIEKPIAEIDAAVFTGELLYSNTDRELLKEYCERWLRTIHEHEAQPLWTPEDDQEFFDACDREGEEKS